MNRRFVNIILPDVENAEYIVKYWHEAGTAGQGVSGVVPLSWQEIRAWRLENELELTSFELNSIRRMSCEYCSEYIKDDPERLAPLPIDEDDFDRVAQGEAMKERNRLARERKKQEQMERYIVE